MISHAEVPPRELIGRHVSLTYVAASAGGC